MNDVKDIVNPDQAFAGVQAADSTPKAATCFKGSIAVVTGGGSGIGRALVEALAERGVRAIIVADIDKQAAETCAAHVNQSGLSPARHVALDVSDGNQLAELVRHIETEVGPIDYWFSNAGVNCGKGLGNIADWQKAIDVNLMSHVHAARHVLPLMEQRNTGGFVLTASAAGLLSDMRSAAYTATKHALVGFAEWLAITVRDGVKISCACPEGVLTNMTRPDSKAAGTGVHFAKARDVAEQMLDAMARGDFLVLTHPRTAEFEWRRVQDRTRWIHSLRKARAKALGLDRLFSVE
jgi:NAD(P)-dependent dehydrogenase (short-subunit alcohol dehydrogenase family)